MMYSTGFMWEVDRMLDILNGVKDDMDSFSSSLIISFVLMMVLLLLSC